MPDFATPDPSDRVLAGIRAIVRQEVLFALYGKNYQYVVQSVNGDGTLDLLSGDTTMPPIQNCPIRPGVAGTTIQPSPGSQCTVAFTSDNQPFVASFDTSEAQSLDFEAIMMSFGAGGTTTKIQIGPTLLTTGSVVPGAAARVGDLAGGMFPITNGSLITNIG